VTKLRDTKILEISATLPEPGLAQQFVNYVADETVKLSRGESAVADREIIGEAERLASEAQQRLDRAQEAVCGKLGAGTDRGHAAGDRSGRGPSRKDRSVVDGIRARISRSTSRRPSSQANCPACGRGRRSSKSERWIWKGASKRRAHRLHVEVRNGKGSDAEVKMAQTASESLAARLRDLRATAGTRGERLRVIDPGIVPQRPSSPNVLLNVFAALLLTVIALGAYLTVSFSYQRRREA